MVEIRRWGLVQTEQPPHPLTEADREIRCCMGQMMGLVARAGPSRGENMLCIDVTLKPEMVYSTLVPHLPTKNYLLSRSHIPFSGTLEMVI